MSDAKPFAEAMSDGDEWYVVIDGIKLGSSCANAICHRAARINAAVARERREAAAEALDEAGDFALSAHYGPPIRMIGSLDDGTENRRLLRDWLRIRAAALRKGDG